MKRLFITLSFIALSVAGALAEANFDFSAVCGSGQTLYYQIVAPNAVEITYPNVTDNWEYMYDGYTRPTGDLTIPDTVIDNGVKYAVKSIGQDAFNSCSGITTVSIPNSVTSIYQHAFIGCNNITSVVVPNSVTDIGFGAFYACDLTTISLPFVGDKRHEPTDKYQYPFGYIFGAGNYSGGTQTGQSYYGNSNTTPTSATYCIPTYLKEVIITGSSYIPHFAFNNCKGVTSITIPDTVTKIGDLAFSECVGLTSIAIPNSVSSIGVCAFAGCSNLKSVNIPEGITTIERGTFERCDNLSLIIIPNSVTSLEQWAFYDCQSLKNVFIPKTVTSISIKAFNNATIYCEVVRCPDGWVHNSSESNWYENSTVHWGIKKVKITEEGAFIPTSEEKPYTAKLASGCNKRTIVIPDSVVIGGTVYAVTSIDSKSFSGCSSLKSITIPNTVTSIGEEAFIDCSNLTSVTIPNSVTSIGYAAFGGCSSLESITLPFVGIIVEQPPYKNRFPFGYFFGEDSYSGGTPTEQNVWNIGSGGGNNHQTYYIPTTLKEVVITGGNIIPRDAFQSCTNLTSISIPNTVTSIGLSAFINCTSLTSITIPNSVLNIADCAFMSCTSLQSVIIPKSVSRIGDAVFGNCNLQSITIENTIPPVISTNSFLSDVPIYIPCGSLSAYQSAENWGDYSFVEKMMYKFEISSADNDKGSVEIMREPTCEKSAVIQATAETGYVFYQWSDGNKSNPRYITVTQDTALVAYFVISEIEAEIVSANTVQGTVSNSSGTYHYNDEIEISATANYGYHFARWSDGVTTNQRTVVLSKDTVIEAEFAVNQYAITLQTNNSELGSVAGGGAFNYLSSNEISATANEGYVFAKWEDGNTANPRTVSLTCDTTFTAVFVPAECQLQVATSDEVKGFVSNSSGTYHYKDEVEISATANYGYHFTTWSDGVTKNPRTIQLIKDTVIEAQFAVNQYSIQLQSNDTNMGSANGAGSFDYLSTNKISATPKTGFVFHHWSDENTDNPRTITLTCDTAFTAVFVPDEVNVEVKSADTKHGTVTESTGVYHFNEKIIISAIAVPHYHFVAWSDGNRQNPREVLLRGDTVLTAAFGIDTFSVAAKCDTAMGAVSGAGLYSYGSAAKVEAKPAAHHHFVQWTNGAVQSTQEFVVEHDTAFEAVFAIDRHTVALAASDSLCGAVSGAGSYDYGASVQLLATPAANCYFTGWSDGVTTNPRTLTVEGDTTIVAEFGKLQTVNIMVTANDTLRGTVAGTGSYVVGNNATLSATASAHYLFEQWSDGRTDNPRTVRAIADATYTAVFVPMQYNIILSQNNADMGMVSGSGVYSYGERVSCLAKPYPNYHFVQWSNGSRDNPYEFVISEDVPLLTAYFAAGAVTAIGDESATQPTIYTVGNTIVVENATDEICVYDAMGKLICRDAIHRVRAELRVNAAGVYIVKTGNVVMRVVVE